MATEAYTPEEAAARIRCKPSWLKEQARLRRVPFTMPAGAYRFTEEHIAWILDHFEQQPQMATPPAPARRQRKAAPVTNDDLPTFDVHPSRRLRAAG